MQKKLLHGQVGLLLLVIMGVVVALVMSVASRSLSDTVLSRQERESSAAFSVAEAGIETALNELRQGTVPSGTASLSDSLGFATGQYAVSPTTSYDLYVREGETAHLDLTGFAGPSVTISWTRKTDASENVACTSEGSGLAPAAIEVNALQEASNTTRRSYYNPATCSLSSNGFASSTAGSSIYRSTLTYSVPANTTALRIKPIYSGATIVVSAPGLTTQLYLIQSTATGGDAQKEIEVRRGLDAPPSIFDYAVFSGGTIVK
jgi:hypothetical protein